MVNMLVIMISSAIAVTFIKCGAYAIKVGIGIIMELIKKY